MVFKTSVLLISCLACLLFFLCIRNAIHPTHDVIFYSFNKSSLGHINETKYPKLKDRLCQGMFMFGSCDSSTMHWSPDDCNMKHYTRSYLKKCMTLSSTLEGRNYFVFIGDSRIKQLAGKFLTSVTKSVALNGHNHGYHRDFNVSLVADVLWHMNVDDDMLQSIKQYTNLVIQYQPKFMILSAALHTIIEGGQDSEKMIDDYGKNMTKLRKLLDKLNHSTIIWVLNQKVIESQRNHNLRFVTNELIHRLNSAAIYALTGSNVHIWYSSRLFSFKCPNDYRDAIHMGDVHVKLDAMMLFNLLCNKYEFNTGLCCQQTLKQPTLYTNPKKHNKHL